MSEFKITGRNKVKSAPARADYNKQTVYDIIDCSLICHVGFTVNEQPFVIPTIHVRIDNTIYFHGSNKSRLINHIAGGNQVCISVTKLDGLVLARSVFHHSMNYRSAVIFGSGRLITGREDKLKVFKAITEKLVAGRWGDARIPNEKEIEVTAVASVEIEDASAKIRRGPPGDDKDDYKLNIWAGEIPIEEVRKNPVPDPQLGDAVKLPDYLK
jgi:nitroimidazol reductase NimA-like FMN-containing flavoprotein (pyridoxamine 5'-phosphate oxidase superfamily)